MKTIEEDVKDLLDVTFASMSLSELEGLAKAMGIKSTEDYPDYCGVPGVKFIYHNNWADPEIEYKGRRCSVHCISDTLWYDYTHDDEDNEIYDSPEDEFPQWVRENAETVYELCELALFPETIAA